MGRVGNDVLRTVIMTQQDRFFIPKNIQKIIDSSIVLAIVNVDCKSSMQNKIRDFVSWFGLVQTANLALATLFRTVLGKLDQLCGYRLCRGLCGIEHVAKKNGVPYWVIHSSNSEEFFREIQRLSPDVVLSFSAPQVIREPLLSYPKFGILNVHGSLLPDYRGCFPSFWYLYNGEEYGGATVHLMSEQIDDGDIVAQQEVYIGDCRSVFEVIRRTKEAGGDLMVRVIRDLENGTLRRRPNIGAEGRYFTWPTAEHGRVLRKRNKRLI